MVVVALAIGIAIYFALPFEPQMNLLFLIISLILPLSVLMARFSELGALIAILMVVVAVGTLRASWHSAAVSAIKLDVRPQAYDVRGWIKDIEKSGPRIRWVIAVKNIDGIDADKHPKYIRVSTFNRDFKTGEGVAFRAELSAPRGPAIPGGYDPARSAFYKQIGATGYMLSSPRHFQIDHYSRQERLDRQIAQLRYRLADRIRASAPEKTAGLQTALLTGIRTWIPDHHTEVLRASGMAHILAISGLHMGLISGGFYSLILFGLVRINWLARRRDVRKIAAACGIIIATLYLVMSGASVATQRAYIMACIIFLAIIFDRQAISIRSVAVAGAITLLLHPESLTSPGFQMSFSAVTALVIVYREWDKRRVYSGPKTFLAKRWTDFKALSLTSIVAGGATSAFAILHFNRVASWGLIGNLAAMPVFTAFVMPVALLVYLSLPFGMEGVPLWLMGKGLEYIIIVSEWVADLPGAVKYFASGPGWVTGIFGLAFTALCLGNMKVRATASLVLLFCFVSLWARPQPHIRVGENGAVAFLKFDPDTILYVDRKNSDRYGRNEFLEDMGLTDIPMERIDGTIGHCDGLGCIVKMHSVNIAVLTDLTEIVEDCYHADLVIFPKGVMGARAKRLCVAPVIDKTDLEKLGSHSLYLKDDGEVSIKTARQATALRPWHYGYKSVDE